MKIKLLSGVVLSGKVRKAGAVCEVPASLSKSLIARGKAEAADAANAATGSGSAAKK